MEKTIEKLLLSVNESLRFYKRGGWIDARRTPTSGVNMVDTIEDFIDARFNNEIWGVPEFHAASDLLEGRLFSCHVEGVDEEKKRFKSATLTLIKPEDIEDISERFLPMWQEGRDSDTVKKVHLKEQDLKNLKEVPKQYFEHLGEHTPEYLLKLISKIIAVLL